MSGYKSEVDYAEQDAKTIERLRAEVERLKALLRRHEFVNRKCPECAGWNVGPNGETIEAHTKGCAIAAALDSSPAAPRMYTEEQVRAAWKRANVGFEDDEHDFLYLEDFLKALLESP